MLPLSIVKALVRGRALLTSATSVPPSVIFRSVATVTGASKTSVPLPRSCSSPAPVIFFPVRVRTASSPTLKMELASATTNLSSSPSELTTAFLPASTVIFLTVNDLLSASLFKVSVASPANFSSPTVVSAFPMPSITTSLLKIAASPAPGAVLSLQLVVSLQVPLAPPIHVLSAASAVPARPRAKTAPSAATHKNLLLKTILSSSSKTHKFTKLTKLTKNIRHSKNICHCRPNPETESDPSARPIQTLG